jgi:ATP-dependent Clp protease ATP-binding subunit ClpC
VGAGGAEGAIDASNVLKPALSRGEIQCIGATTFDEYRKYIEKDAALARRFQPITVDPPTNEQTIDILKGLRERYEQHHRVRITDGAIRAAVDLSGRYITGRVQPDKSIDVIDEAGARVRIKSMTKPPDMAELEGQIEKLTVEKDEAVKAADYEKAAELRDKAEQLKKQKEEIQRQWRERSKEVDGSVVEEVVAEVVSRMTGVPLQRLEKEEAQRLLELEKELHKKVISQEEAIRAVAKAIRRARAGLKDPKRPMGSFIFIGPSGVGKTLLSKALAEFMFGDEEALVHLDMSEYMEKHNVSRLIGAPPGYVGYEEGGQLTERIRRRPYAVILLDENTILIMTSNIGADLIKGGAGFGFARRSAEVDYENIKNILMKEVERFFRPEFINRLDDVIVFHPLTREDLVQIVEYEVGKVAKRLVQRGVRLELDQAAKDFLIEKGYSPEYGARPLRRAIGTFVEDPLSEMLLAGEFGDKQHIRVTRKTGADGKPAENLFFEAVEAPAEPPKPEPAGAGTG